MPRFSQEPGLWAGSRKPVGLPLDVLDAQRRLIDRHIVYFDTDTGVVVSLVVDKNGNMVLDGIHKQVVRRVEVFPAPLTTRPAAHQLIVPDKEFR